MLDKISIIAWLSNNQIRTETGDLIDLKSHFYLYDIYRDFSPFLVVKKAAQVGLTTTQILKTIWGVSRYKIDSITTYPTVADAQEISGSKVNRLIAQNPIIGKMISSNKDSVSMKQIAGNIWHIRGTWTDKAAMMVSSDWNSMDEVDASKQDVLEMYDTRLQHSKYRWRHFYSHPSSEGFGIDKLFTQTDQKHWFIKCPKCFKEQFLSWPESLDPERRVYQCKYCQAELSDENRRVGRWVKKYADREGSGYWIPLLICPWVSAEQVLKYHEEKSEEYFYNKVLGLAYVGKGNKVTWDVIRRNIVQDTHLQQGRIVIGVDTGTTIWYVVGDKQGVFHYGSAKGYEEIEGYLERWPNSIAVFDQGGDLIAPRKLQEKYHGRIFLCHYRSDRKTQQLITWGKGEEAGNVVVDRNRMLQLLVDELTDRRIALWGSENDWYDFYLHWANIYRVEEENALGVPVKRWERSGDDHWCHSLLYWRVGISRFAQEAEFGHMKLDIPESPVIENGKIIAPKLEGAPIDDWEL